MSIHDNRFYQILTKRSGNISNYIKRRNKYHQCNGEPYHRTIYYNACLELLFILWIFLPIFHSSYSPFFEIIFGRVLVCRLISYRSSPSRKWEGLLFFIFYIMRSSKWPNWHVISAGWDNSPKIIDFDWVTVLVDTRRKIATIITISEWWRTLQVIYKNYKRLARAGFIFEIPGRNNVTIPGRITLMEALSAPNFWETLPISPIEREAQKSSWKRVDKPNF